VSAADRERLARLAAGFEAVVTGHGVVMIEPALPIYVQLLPDGESLPVKVRWPDGRGEQPPIGTRVAVSSRGQIEILSDNGRL